MSDQVEFDIYETPDGVDYNLSDWGKTFLLSRSGEGLPPIEYRTDRGPFQDGETVRDFVLRPRVLQYTMRFDTQSRQRYWDERSKIMSIFRPNRQFSGTLNPGKLKKYLKDGSIRALDVFIDQGLDFSQAEGGGWDEFGSVETIRFVAYNPIYYDPTQKTLEFSLGALSELVFPITFPISFGSTVIDDDTVITYLGTWAEYPIIVITGPISAPTIENVTTGKTLTLDYNVPSGRILTIDLRYSKKTITDDLGTNLVGALSPSSDFSVWRLAPHPEATDGKNTIHISGGNALPGETKIELEYYDRYSGM